MFVIGDVHGCYDTLVGLIEQLPEDSEICFVGDLIDRGPKSMQVVELIKNNPKYHCVRGNHEEMMIDDAENVIEFTSKWPDGRVYNHPHSIWCTNGGSETIQSYCTVEGECHNARSIFNMDKFIAHVDWMKELPIYKEFDIQDEHGRNLVVSHSIIRNWESRNGNNLGHFNETLLWGRNFSGLKDQGIFNIIGHTPQENGATVKSIYANVDTGACYKREGLQRLTAIEFPTMELYTQDSEDANEEHLW